MNEADESDRHECTDDVRTTRSEDHLANRRDRQVLMGQTRSAESKQECSVRKNVNSAEEQDPIDQ